MIDYNAEKLLSELESYVVPDKHSNSQGLKDFKECFQINSIDDLRFQMIILAFILWATKKYENVCSMGTFLDYIYDNVDDTGAPVWRIFDEIQFFYSHYTSEWDRLLAFLEKHTEEEFANCVLNTAHFVDTPYEEAPDSIKELCEKLLVINQDDCLAELNSYSNDFLFNCDEKQHAASYISCIEDGEYNFASVSAFMKAMVKGINNFTCMELPGDRLKNVTKGLINLIDVTWTSNSWHRYISQYIPNYPDGNSIWDVLAASITVSSDAKLVAIVNAGQLSNKTDVEFRKYLCENGLIECVIALPEKMYKNTWINPFIIVASHNNSEIRFIDGRNEYFADRIGGKRINALSNDTITNILEQYNNESTTNQISIKDISAENYNLNPLRYLANSEVIASEYIQLEEIVQSSRRGMTLKAAEMDRLISNTPSGIKCIKPSHIATGCILDYEYYHSEIKKIEKNMAHKGDLLISKVGSPFKIAVSDDDYLVIGNVYIFTLRNTIVSPEYIKCFLESNAGQKELVSLATGSATPIINISNVGSIKIPLFNTQTQNDYLDKVKNINNELKNAYQQIQELRSEVNNMFDEDALLMDKVISFEGVKDKVLEKKYIRLVKNQFATDYPAKELFDIAIYVKEDEHKIFYVANKELVGSVTI